jgi:hypothetical protein
LPTIADAGGTNAAGDEGNWDVELGGQLIAEGREKASAAAGRAGLRIGAGLPPVCGRHGNHEWVGCGEFRFAVVGGVGLSGNHEDLADAHVFDGGELNGFSLQHAAHLHFVPTTGGRFHGRFEAWDSRLVGKWLPSAVGRGDQPDLQ